MGVAELLRVLSVGCGGGLFPNHAAVENGIRVFDTVVHHALCKRNPNNVQYGWEPIERRDKFLIHRAWVDDARPGDVIGIAHSFQYESGRHS